MKLKILTGEDQKNLRRTAEVVKTFDESVGETIQNMHDTIIDSGEDGPVGIGLAANQVGILQRIILVTFNLGKGSQKIVPMINPEILDQSAEKISMEEGCLSLPGLYAHVSRPTWVRVAWQNPNGVHIKKKLTGWESRIFQHELDHINGVLFIDHLNRKELQKLNKST